MLVKEKTILLICIYSGIDNAFYKLNNYFALNCMLTSEIIAEVNIADCRLY